MNAGIMGADGFLSMRNLFICLTVPFNFLFGVSWTPFTSPFL